MDDKDLGGKKYDKEGSGNAVDEFVNNVGYQVFRQYLNVFSTYSLLSGERLC